MQHLLENTGHYVTGLLRSTLSPELHFHNLNHTLEVVAAAGEIGSHSGLSDDDMEILLAAAWFHDCGYTKIYTGHEAESIHIAHGFLREQGCNSTFMAKVSEAIQATRFPQNPGSLLAEVLCDADLYHFTRPAYPRYEAAIRQEFETFLGKKYTDGEWKRINGGMLASHSYFTGYGKKVLTRFKEVTIRLMAQGQ